VAPLLAVGLTLTLALVAALTGQPPKVAQPKVAHLQLTKVAHLQLNPVPESDTRHVNTVPALAALLVGLAAAVAANN
jgi:hypothetical protein